MYTLKTKKGTIPFVTKKEFITEDKRFAVLKQDSSVSDDPYTVLIQLDVEYDETKDYYACLFDSEEEECLGTYCVLIGVYADEVDFIFEAKTHSV